MDGNTTLFAILLIGFALFMIGREVVCWYWKMNTVVALLERIAKDLEVKPLP